MKKQYALWGLLGTAFLSLACSGEQEDSANLDDNDSLENPEGGEEKLPADEAEMVVEEKGCQLFEPTNPPAGVTVLYEKGQGNSEPVVTFKRLDGESGVLFLEEDGTLFEISLADGAKRNLGPAPEGNYTLFEDKIIWSTSDLSSNATVHTIAPFDNPEQTVELAAIALSSYRGSEGFFYDKQEPSAIWFAPYDGSEPRELVPAGSTNGAVESDGYFYWADFVTRRLERVPLEGGEREELANVAWGGAMHAGFGQIFIRDDNFNNLERWVPGEVEMEQLHQGWVTSLVPFEGGAYFMPSGSCGELMRATSSEDKTVVASGFEGISGTFGGSDSYLRGGDGDALYVEDVNAIYKIEL